MKFYAGMDIGGTTGRLKLSDAQGNVIGEFFGDGGSINTEGYEKCNEKYRKLVLPALSASGLTPEECGKICIAASGVDSKRQEAECRKSFEGMGFLEESIMICNDCEIFLYASEGPAIVLISGTGSIAYARSADGGIVRVGGWNHLLSDEGSGYYIGRMVVKEAADYIDGRVDSPLLCRLFTEKTGLCELEEIDAFLNERLSEKSEIASFSMLAEEARRQGEESGQRILEDAAGVLFKLVEDVRKKAGFEKDGGERKINLWLWGSVLVKNEFMASALKRRIAESFPEMEAKTPEMTALDLALKVAREKGAGS